MGFREDDRVTKALMKFLRPVADTGNLPDLLQAIFFARWCNRDSTLESLDASLLKDPTALKSTLQSSSGGSWANETAYPVEEISWDGAKFDRLEAATTLFAKITPFLVQAIEGAERSVQKATDAVNAKFGMSNDFPIFMACMDIAWFRPDLIDPASKVPLGIGTIAFVKRLQEHLKIADHNELFER